MKDDQDDRFQRITLRIPKELHSRLMREASFWTRSMNAEIISRLEQSIIRDDNPASDELKDQHALIIQEHTKLRDRLKYVLDAQEETREFNKTVINTLRDVSVKLNIPLPASLDTKGD